MACCSSYGQISFSSTKLSISSRHIRMISAALNLLTGILQSMTLRGVSFSLLDKTHSDSLYGLGPSKSLRTVVEPAAMILAGLLGSRTTLEKLLRRENKSTDTLFDPRSQDSASPSEKDPYLLLFHRFAVP